MIPGPLGAIELEENTEQLDLLDYEASGARLAEIRKAQEEVDSPTGTRRVLSRNAKCRRQDNRERCMDFQVICLDGGGDSSVGSGAAIREFLALVRHARGADARRRMRPGQRPPTPWDRAR